MAKLLQINECLNFSTGKIAQHIGEVAIDSGWESWIAYSGRQKSIPSKSNVIKVGSTFASIAHYVNFRMFDKEGLCSNYQTKSLIERIKSIAPDIIHLHNIHDHWLNYELLFDYLAHINKPIVWTQHDCWAFTGGCMYYDLLGCNKWKEECDKCPDRRSIINRANFNYRNKKRYISKLDKIVFVPVSDWLANALRESAFSKKPIVTIHNGIDIDTFRPLARNKNKTTFNILGVAAVWDARKGLDDFIKLRGLLSDEMFSITLVGLNKKQIKSLPTGINGIERTHNVDELVKLYSDADVFVNPTYSDNFPTTNIEALACGTPVITYNTGGSPEAIDDKTGFVVEQGNLEALTNAITSLREKPLDPKECRKRAETLFNKEDRFKDYINLYEQLLKQ